MLLQTSHLQNCTLPCLQLPSRLEYIESNQFIRSLPDALQPDYLKKLLLSRVLATASTLQSLPSTFIFAKRGASKVFGHPTFKRIEIEEIENISKTTLTFNTLGSLHITIVMRKLEWI